MLSLRVIVGSGVLRIFFLWWLCLAAKGTEASKCENLVEAHDIIEDHAGLIGCHYNGQNMTVVWSESKEIDGLQIEYQCFDETLENASQLNQTNNIVAIPNNFFGKPAKAADVEITNSTCVIFGCVDLHGRSTPMRWTDAFICFPPAPEVPTMSSSYVLSTKVLLDSLEGTPTATPTPEGAPNATPSSSSSPTSLTTFYTLIAASGSVVILFAAVFGAVIVTCVCKRHNKKRIYEVEIEELQDSVFCFKEIFQVYPLSGKDDLETVTLYHYLESIPAVSNCSTFPRALSDVYRRREMSITPAPEDLSTSSPKKAPPQLVLNVDVGEYIHCDFEKSRSETMFDS